MLSSFVLVVVLVLDSFDPRTTDDDDRANNSA